MAAPIAAVSFSARERVPVAAAYDHWMLRAIDRAGG
jgi:hypothetical protein